ncbi:MAG: hypothetical protein M3237_08390, partial [Actinomycetota bacterium]|nr:hypothetical protein [Actinomycetota bacterium]
ASGIGLATSVGDGPGRGNDAASLPGSDAALLDSCRSGNTSDAGREAIFGSGTPTVKAVARTERLIVLAVESADGSHWGDCFVSLVDSEFTSGMAVYDATSQTRNSMSTSGFAGCGEQERCTQFSVSVVDRRVPAVAAVEFLTADGRTTRVDTVDGYYAFNYVGPLPEGSDFDIDDVGEFSPLKRITFLDASGTPIAAEAQDGSGRGEDGESVPGLPSIREFPSLRSEQGF